MPCFVIALLQFLSAARYMRLGIDVPLPNSSEAISVEPVRIINNKA